jgi:hypothetical protein
MRTENWEPLTTDNGLDLEVQPERLEQAGAECEAAPECRQREQASAGGQCNRYATLPTACLLDPRLEAVERDIAAEQCCGADDYHYQWKNNR